MLFLEALLVGLAVGAVVGALGAGGGILAVPILVYLLHQEPHAAAASSLVIVGLTAAASLPHHASRRHVQWREGALFGVLAVLGAVAGSRLSLLVPPRTLMVLFAGLLAVVAAAMARSGVRSRRIEDAAGAPPTPPSTLVVDAQSDPRNPDPSPPTGRTLAGWWTIVLAASVTGFLTGFFGVGGGFIVVPMLVLALRLPMRQASGTSLLVMIITVLASLAARIGSAVQVDWPLTLAFCAGSMLGGVAGGPLASRARASTLTLVFAALLLAVSVTTITQTLLATP